MVNTQVLTHGTWQLPFSAISVAHSSLPPPGHVDAEDLGSHLNSATPLETLGNFRNPMCFRCLLCLSRIMKMSYMVAVIINQKHLTNLLHTQNIWIHLLQRFFFLEYLLRYFRQFLFDILGVSRLQPRFHEISSFFTGPSFHLASHPII